jgi:hypothetical protein
MFLDLRFNELEFPQYELDHKGSSDKFDFVANWLRNNPKISTGKVVASEDSYQFEFEYNQMRMLVSLHPYQGLLIRSLFSNESKPGVKEAVMQIGNILKEKLLFKDWQETGNNPDDSRVGYRLFLYFVHKDGGSVTIWESTTKTEFLVEVEIHGVQMGSAYLNGTKEVWDYVRKKIERINQFFENQRVPKEKRDSLWRQNHRICLFDLSGVSVY